MAMAVVSSAVKVLGDLLVQEATSLYGVTEQVEHLQTELRLMQSYLHDADKRQDEDEAVRVWVSEIREAAYKAEDVVESFGLKIASRRKGGIQNTLKRCACIIDEAADLHEVGTEIEAIKTKISNLTRSLQTYGIKPKNEREGSSSTQRHWRQSFAHVVEDFTIGLDQDIEILVPQLVNITEENYGIVSIFGMGGLGKTTLARKVFHHTRIRRHFGNFAWAHVSQQCRRRDVWEGILFELISPSQEQRREIKELRDEEVAYKLYQVQLNNKCFVIIDDIWTIETWDSLRPAFPVGQKVGSKMLLTTRNKEVAQHVDPNGFLCEPHYLTEDEGWELLKKKAFPEKHDSDFEINKDMEKLGREIVKKCASLPLAIVVIGALLAIKQPTPNDWNMVHENISLYLRGCKGHSEVSKVLALSYNELPYQLKPCFLHLSQFPEDFEIPTKKLIRMWIAEGIVSPMQLEGEETLEDVAHRYLGELLNRCMIQVGARGPTRRVKTCHLHDLMRDLCLLKADEEDFVKIIHLEDRNKQCWIHRPKKKEWISGKLESAIGNLIHLRYLSLDCNNVTNVPSSIGNLRCLQTLILKNVWSQPILSNVIWKMEQLRHLYLPYRDEDKPISRGKLRLGNLRELQTLDFFRTSDCDIKDLTKFTNLKKLGIKLESFEEFVEVLRSSRVTFNSLCSLNCLFNFSNVEETDLRILLWGCPHLYKLYLNGGTIVKLPEYHHFPQNLTKLTLVSSGLEEDPMPTLEKLPNLSILRLQWFVFKGKKMVCSSKGFPQLKSLVLYSLENWEEWCVGEEAMSSLCQLVVDGCWKLKMVPVGLRFITTLQELQIGRMPEEFENRLRGGEDLYKVKHVPSIIYKGYYRGNKMVCSLKGFPQLKSLVRKRLDNLEEWCVTEEAMPSLCQLVIDYCQKLKMVLDGLRFLTTLRELQIVWMPAHFDNRLRGANEGGGGEDLYEVQHVPSIIFKKWTILLKVIS
ncbi:hypothetical protein L1049_014581 [Liquidambar formosana]|uniref:Disease resistance protein At1g50180 n=1 Tax=Liquidambar formosana TaxID=63359 RepID=A0AAP0RWS3_LIQFO